MCFVLESGVGQLRSGLISCFTSLERFADLCLQIYLNPEILSQTDFITIDAGLYYIFLEHSFVAQDEVKRDEYKANAHLCQCNLETAITNLNLMLPHTYETVEALLLGTCYAIEVSRAPLAWLLNSTAVTIGQTLGFHQCSPTNADTDNKQKQQALLFWMAYAFDKSLALRLGYAPLLSDNDFNNSLKALDAVNDDWIEAYRAWIVHAQIQERMYEQLYSAAALALPSAQRQNLAKIMSQKALLLEEVGKPLTVGDRQIPKPGKNELLVKVLVAGLNPHDQKCRDDGLFVTSVPFVLASDLVGEVVSVGPGELSATFKLGERVFGHTFTEGGVNNDFNGAQQYALVDTRFVGRVSESGLSNDEVSTIPVNVLAGFIALFASSGHGIPAPFSKEAKDFDYANATLLVIGGGSNTGRATVELAKMAGIGRIIAVAGRRNEENLKSIGATHVIDRQASDVREQIHAITGDDLIYAVDTVNAGVDQELGVAALSNTKKGTLITLRQANGGLDNARIGVKSNGFERRHIFGVSPMHPEVTVQFWEEIPRWLKEGKIRPSKFDVINGLDADATNKALDQYRDGKGVKVNIHPWGSTV
ncbi:Zinc-type alcohol dehydrogenase [Paramyrothecium foliicola]|nr:Zinc-type alcohol dehydrogenase [Paramyrothecium foliicola]